MKVNCVGSKRPWVTNSSIAPISHGRAGDWRRYCVRASVWSVSFSFSTIQFSVCGRHAMTWQNFLSCDTMAKMNRRMKNENETREKDNGTTSLRVNLKNRMRWITKHMNDNTTRRIVQNPTTGTRSSFFFCFFFGSFYECSTCTCPRRIGCAYPSVC